NVSQTDSMTAENSSAPNPDESLALILGDLSPTPASAHMNYLINLLKSVSRAVSAARRAYSTPLQLPVNDDEK
ncbi:hypothetical protein, partial [Vreelandella jeotgali]|uniref:hypothetical protein n=1 Tax=Vreelandella jeotgali TaxID=553386 RepID=UPI001C3F4054